MNTKAKEPVAVATLKFEKETKSTYRFQEVDTAGNVVDRHDASIGTLYLKKLFFTEKPSGVTITVTAD